MSGKGFTSHALMGAAALGAVWFAVYLPSFVLAFRMGGWPSGLAAGAGLLGLLGGPLFLIYLEGDEGFGLLGILAAIFLGWACAKGAKAFGMPPATAELVRLWGAALGPLLLFACFHLLARRAGRKG